MAARGNSAAHEILVCGDIFRLEPASTHAMPGFARVPPHEAAWLVEGWARDGHACALARVAEACGLERDPGVVAQELRRFCGRIVLLRREIPRVALDPGAEPVALASLLADPEPSSIEEEHWIEIRLVDEAGEPVAGEPYRIELPDGRLREGRTDEHGIVRIDPIHRAGQCRVDFPDVREQLAETG
jgi:hypothetical protein